MEKIGGGQAAPWNNAAECNKLADGLAGASLVWGFASLFTAGGVGVRAAMARLGMTVFFSIPLWGQVALAAAVVGCSFHNAS